MLKLLKGQNRTQNGKNCFLHKKLLTLKKVKIKNLQFVSRTMQSAMGHVSGDVESVKYVSINL